MNATLQNSILCSMFSAALFATPLPAQTNRPPPPPDPDALYEDVKKAISERQFVEADRIIDKILAASPLFPEAHRARAYVAYELGRYAEAEAALDEFRRLVPQDRHNILILLGRIQMGRGKYREAADTFERVVLLKPTVAGIYTSLGKLYYHLKNFELAIEKFETALRRDPPEFREESVPLLKSAYALHIDRLIEQNRQEEAVPYLDRALDLDPPAVIAFLKRGAVLSGLGANLSQAETDVVTYIADNPGKTRAHLLLGNIRQQQGRTAEAMKSYERAIELDPDIPGVNAVLGALYYKEKKFKLAIDHLTRAAELDPKDTLIRYYLGLAYLRAEAFDKAAEAMTSIMETRPELPAPHLILAQVALYEGQVELALQHLEDWAERVKERKDMELLNTERVFEMLYNNAQYHALVNGLKARL